LANNQSLIIRYQNWTSILGKLSSDPYAMLFGYGVSANDVLLNEKIIKSDRPTNLSIIVDNGYLAYIIFGGVFLLLIQVFLQYKVFKSLYLSYVSGKDKTMFYLLIFYCSTPIYNLFGNLNSSILLLGIVPIIFSRRKM